MRALLAWELGSGLGHATRLLEVARVLRERGFEIIVSGRQEIPPDITGSNLIDRQISLPIIDPIPISDEFLPFSARSFDDVLGLYGFGSAEVLSARIDLWQKTFDDIKPDLVVSDFSPMLTFAAKLARIPVINIGDGYVIPPEVDGKFPEIHKAKGCGISPSTLLENALAISGRAGSTLGEIIAGDESVICVLPQLDLYRDSRLEPAHGQFAALPKPSPHDSGAPVLVYLDARFPPTVDLLRYLAEKKISAIGHVRNLADHSREQLANHGVRLTEHPLPLAEKLPEVSGVIHHGGISTAQEAAAAGRPQSIFPRYLEQTLTAVRLHELKVGTVYHRTFTMEETLTAVQHPFGAEKAAELAQAISKFKPTSHSRLAAFVDGISPQGMGPQ